MPLSAIEQRIAFGATLLFRRVPAPHFSCFSRHFERAPDRIGLEEVRAYQLHLIAVPGFGAVKILFGAARDAKMPERYAVGQLKRFVSNVEIERHVYD